MKAAHFIIEVSCLMVLSEDVLYNCYEQYMRRYVLPGLMTPPGPPEASVETFLAATHSRRCAQYSA